MHKQKIKNINLYSLSEYFFINLYFETVKGKTKKSYNPKLNTFKNKK